jgi:hypothetical protein
LETEVPSFDAGAPAFLAWAGDAADVRVFYGPDPILAVDQPGRRGYFVDDVYLAVAWIAEGGDELMRALKARGVEAKSWTPSSANQHELLAMVTRAGSPVPSRDS